MKSSQSGEKDENMRKVFVENYGVQLDLPVFYYQEAKFVPHYPQLVVTTTKNINPKGDNIEIYTHLIGEEQCKKHKMGEIYEDGSRSTFLYLNRIDGRNGLKIEKQVIIEDKERIMMQFSNSGSYFAIYSFDQCALEVYDSTDIFKCFDAIENNAPKYDVCFHDRFIMDPKELIFGQNCDYIGMYTEKRVIIVALVKDKFSKQAGVIVQDFVPH